MKIFILLALLVQSLHSYCQSPTYPIIIMDVNAVPISNDTTGGLPDISDSTVFNVSMNVALFDTINIDEIIIRLGDPGLSGNRIQHTFDWDVFGPAGNGTSYSRTGYNVALFLGQFIGLLSYEADLKIKRSDGTFTDLVTFSR
jgi:hypothetical protein